jgi:hypothetical protein
MKDESEFNNPPERITARKRCRNVPASTGLALGKPGGATTDRAARGGHLSLAGIAYTCLVVRRKRIPESQERSRNHEENEATRDCRHAPCFVLSCSGVFVIRFSAEPSVLQAAH